MHSLSRRVSCSVDVDFGIVHVCLGTHQQDRDRAIARAIPGLPWAPRRRNAFCRAAILRRRWSHGLIQPTHPRHLAMPDRVLGRSDHHGCHFRRRRERIEWRRPTAISRLVKTGQRQCQCQCQTRQAETQPRRLDPLFRPPRNSSVRLRTAVYPSRTCPQARVCLHDRLPIFGAGLVGRDLLALPQKVCPATGRGNGKLTQCEVAYSRNIINARLDHSDGDSAIPDAQLQHDGAAVSNHESYRPLIEPMGMGE